MKKQIMYQVNREINWTPIMKEEGIMAYHEKLMIGERVLSEKEGIAYLDEILNKKSDEPITNLRIEVNINNKSHYVPAALYKSSGREAFRKNLIGSTEGIEKIREEIIEKPYSYIKEHGNNHVEIILFYFYNHSAYDLQGNAIPKAIYFDYISANIHNQHYNLTELYEKLSQREDIEFILGKRDKHPIKEIPYYNSEEDRDKCMEFIWIPSDEDFKKIEEDLHDPSYIRYQKIVEKIFGVKMKKVIY
jgi:hypothetical protein